MSAVEMFQAMGLGFGTGLALIVAIGTQNAFVLRQGIQREHVTVVVLICAVSDAVLISAGVLGIGILFQTAPVIVDVIRIAGAAFLLAYAALAAKRAIRPGRLTAADAPRELSASSAVWAVLALTWLNPHVYLDTVLLLGSVANQQVPDARWWFAGGAILGSFIWFSALGFGARLLRPFFSKPSSWRILDGLIAAIMLILGLRMAVGA
ncbi:LysE/ArgO family amino acid transporter [Arthrobacter sp. H14]|uniref:LysE/ArgO family amino acid transporter n=1 Tax=Arthrobacter sp. H14 TaxID=1312959 RepID=UPI000479B0FC|nr:LysE/ArgO family amino acid transporter [Arthrobacter sp. H14]